MQNFANVIIILYIRSVEVFSFQINCYEVNPSNSLIWYKNGYSWYCIRYAKNKEENKDNSELYSFLFIKKNPEHVRILLI